MNKLKFWNRTIQDGIKNRLEKSKGKCPRELPHVFCSYWTKPKKATGETLYCLAYEIKTLILIKVNHPSFWTLIFESEANKVGLRTNLDFLKGNKEQVELRRRAFQERLVKASNSKVKLKNISVGDLVLRRTKLDSRRLEGGVFGLNW